MKSTFCCFVDRGGEKEKDTTNYKQGQFIIYNIYESTFSKEVKYLSLFEGDCNSRRFDIDGNHGRSTAFNQEDHHQEANEEVCSSSE